MKLKALTSAIVLATLPMTGVFAAAMDRSGQSIAAFLQPGNYFEAGLSVLDADVSGTSSSFTTPAGMTPQQNTGDMASSYYFPSAALKIQATDHISVGLLYDQPYGAKAEYKDPTFGFTANGEGTSAEVHTENLSLLLGYQPNENWNIYGGPVFQQAKGDVTLRGAAYSALSGYNANLKNDSEVGWLAGVAYQIPEIALKASVTYRSEIKHELTSDEDFGATSVRQQAWNTVYGLTLQSTGSQATAAGTANALVPATYESGKTKVTTPQSVNLDLQTGIMADTVAFLNVRWVDWDGFAIRPVQFGQMLDSLSNLPGQSGLKGGNLVEYKKAQWSAAGGVGRKFSEQWAGNVSVGWDSGAGNPVTTLGPTEGYWNLGVGIQFSPASNYFIAGGVKYFWLKDATALTVANPNVGEFKDNHAIAYGLKIGYRF